MGRKGKSSPTSTLYLRAFPHFLNTQGNGKGNAFNTCIVYRLNQLCRKLLDMQLISRIVHFVVQRRISFTLRSTIDATTLWDPRDRSLPTSEDDGTKGFWSPQNFVYLTVRKIIKFVATRRQILELHQIQFLLGLCHRRGWESLQRSPIFPSWI